MKYCTKCGAAMEDGENLCNSCSVTSNKQPDASVTQKVANINVLSIVAFGVSVITTLFGLAVILMMAVSPNIAGALYGLLGLLLYIIAGSVSLALSVGGLIWTLVGKYRGKWFAIIGMILIIIGFIAIGLIFVCS